MNSIDYLEECVKVQKERGDEYATEDAGDDKNTEAGPDTLEELRRATNCVERVVDFDLPFLGEDAFLGTAGRTGSLDGSSRLNTPTDLLLVFVTEHQDYLSSCADNKPAIAESAKTVSTTCVASGIMIRDITSNDATQTLVHHIQVKKYPNLLLSGGNFFHIQLRGLSKISSLTINLDIL